MSYRFEAAPKALVAERRAQFIALGVPLVIVDAVTGRLGGELWEDEATSWVYEWSGEAALAESRGDLLMFVANGANDPYVPASDTTLFDGRPNTVVRLEAGATHCAAKKSAQVNPAAFAWLQSQLG
jgi:hypothetical protein